MEIRKLEADDLSQTDLVLLAEIERAGRGEYASMEQLMEMLRCQETYACFRGEKMAAYIVLDRNHPYCGGSLHIAQMKPSWDCFTDDVLHFLILGAMSACCSAHAEPYITVDVHRKHDLFTPVYRSLGFRESIYSSSVSAEHMVLVASGKKLTGRG